MKIGPVHLSWPFAVAPMAGMTDTAFRRLVKRQGGCGLVVTEMVSSEGLVRGIDRTLEYAEYTEEERPVSIQIFGGDPAKMEAAAEIVEGMGADIVDVNMGCPVPKIAKHSAGCSLMREPEHAASVIEAMARAVKIPVTVKMRAGWNDTERNAPRLAKMVEDAGAAAVAVHGRTAAQSYSGSADWELVAEIADTLTIPVFGSGDCIEPLDVVNRLRGVDGVLVGRGVLRNPWVLAQAADMAAGRRPREVTFADRGWFLLEYIDLLLKERVHEPEGFRHTAPGAWPSLETACRPELELGRRDAAPGRLELSASARVSASELRRTRRSLGEGGQLGRPDVAQDFSPAHKSHDRWVINKVRALGCWYTKGLDNGSRLRTATNTARSLAELRDVIAAFFFASPNQQSAIDPQSAI